MGAAAMQKSVDELKAVDNATKSIALQMVCRLHLKALLLNLPPCNSLSLPWTVWHCLPSPAGMLEAGQSASAPTTCYRGPLNALGCHPWLRDFLLPRPVPRGSCMPETWRTSLLLLAGITLEQKGSNKHFHSCWLVPHCYSLASHTQPSAAIQSLLEGMEETPQQPSVCL